MKSIIMNRVEKRKKRKKMTLLRKNLKLRMKILNKVNKEKELDIMTLIYLLNNFLFNFT